MRFIQLALMLISLAFFLANHADARATGRATPVSPTYVGTGSGGCKPTPRHLPSRRHLNCSLEKQRAK